MCSIITAAFIFLVSRQPNLVMFNSETGEVYRRWEVTDDLTFSITFIHSVNQTPVCDTFRIDGDQIRPVSTIYRSFGAGVQTEIEAGQTLSYDQEGNMVITGFHQSYPRLSYIVGTVSDHLLEIGPEQISLRDLCGRNAHVAFEVRYL